MKVTDKITITNEDNMLLMARYPDNYFDLAIVDPPYGIGYDGANKTSGSHDYKYELTACELDKEYYDKAIQRIINHTNQQTLF